MTTWSKVRQNVYVNWLNLTLALNLTLTFRFSAAPVKSIFLTANC